jgi:hypothetical protein
MQKQKVINIFFSQRATEKTQSTTEVYFSVAHYVSSVALCDQFLYIRNLKTPG